MNCTTILPLNSLMYLQINPHLIRTAHGPVVDYQNEHEDAEIGRVWPICGSGASPPHSIASVGLSHSSPLIHVAVLAQATRMVSWPR